MWTGVLNLGVWKYTVWILRGKSLSKGWCGQEGWLLPRVALLPRIHDFTPKAACSAQMQGEEERGAPTDPSA